MQELQLQDRSQRQGGGGLSGSVSKRYRREDGGVYRRGGIEAVAGAKARAPTAGAGSPLGLMGNEAVNLLTDTRLRRSI